MKMFELKRNFLQYLEIERGRSLKTIENYERYLTAFLDFSKVIKPNLITDAMVRDFRLFLNRRLIHSSRSEHETLKKKTQNYYLIALRAFLKYLVRQEILTLPPERIELAKVSERTIDLITDVELSRLLNAPAGHALKILRDRAILELLFSTGLRVSELTALSRYQDFSRGEISVRGKGEKVRVVFVSDSALRAINEYLKKRIDMSDALFVQLRKGSEEKKNSEPLTSRSVERIVKQYAIKAGIDKKVTPHIIRHSFATNLLHNGADIRSVQALLGHSNISTTQVYTHVTDRHLKDIHTRFHKKLGK